jgi:hypothetical protein
LTTAINAIPNTLLGGGTTDAFAVLTKPRCVADAWSEDERKDFLLRDANAARMDALRTKNEAAERAVITRQDKEMAACCSRPNPSQSCTSYTLTTSSGNVSHLFARFV